MAFINWLKVSDLYTLMDNILFKHVFFLENFADSKKLRGGVYFVDQFPTTQTGKIQRFLIKNLATTLYKKSQLLK